MELLEEGVAMSLPLLHLPVDEPLDTIVRRVLDDPAVLARVVERIASSPELVARLRDAIGAEV